MNQRRTDLLVRDRHAAVGRTAAHLRAVGRDPGDLTAGQHAGAGHQLTEQQNALTAETGKLDPHLLERSAEVGKIDLVADGRHIE